MGKTLQGANKVGKNQLRKKTAWAFPKKTPKGLKVPTPGRPQGGRLTLSGNQLGEKGVWGDPGGGVALAKWKLWKPLPLLGVPKEAPFSNRGKICAISSWKGPLWGENPPGRPPPKILGRNTKGVPTRGKIFPNSFGGGDFFISTSLVPQKSGGVFS